MRAYVPRLADFAGGELPLRDAKLVVAREYGFPTWRELTVHVEKAIREHEGQRDGERAGRGGARRRSAPATSRRCARCSTASPSSTGDVHTGAWSTLLEAIAQPDVVGDDLETELGVDPRVVELLIERGSSLDGPLNLAACFNRSELVRLLLDGRRAAPAATPIWGITPLQTAIYHGSAEAADLLAAVALVPDALYVAAATGRLDALDRWFDGGALRPEAFANRPNLADVGWPPAAPPLDDPQDVLDEAFALAAFNGRLEALDLAARPRRERRRPRARADRAPLRDHPRPARRRAVAARPRRRRRRCATRSTPARRSAGRAARRDGAGRTGSRSATCWSSAARRARAGDLGLAFERAWATWGERGEALLDSGLRYGGTDPVLVHVTKREGRYSFTDRGEAFRLAGRRRTAGARPPTRSSTSTPST